MRAVDLREYLAKREILLKLATEVAVARAREYAGDEDVLRNFRTGAEMVGIPVSHGIYVRLVDKVSRLGQQLRKGAPVYRMYDSILDLVNYAILLYVAVDSEQGDGGGDDSG